LFSDISKDRFLHVFKDITDPSIVHQYTKGDAYELEYDDSENIKQFYNVENTVPADLLQLRPELQQLRTNFLLKEEKERQLQRQIDNLQKQIDHKDQAIAKKDQAIAHYREGLETTRSELEITRGKLETTHSELETIHSSHGWKLLRCYYKFRDKIFHPNTKGRVYAKSLKEAVIRMIRASYFVILARALLWFFCPLSRSKLAKVWVAYKLGGLKLCWEKAVERFGTAKKAEAFITTDHFSKASALPLRVKGQSFQPRAFLKQLLRANLYLFLSQHHAKLVFPQFEEPTVSIIIPTFNNAEHLYQCLEAILSHTDVPFELIVVNDCSSDMTPQLLEKVENIQIINNEENLEFIRSCNIGSKLAKGRYILFLNEDINVTPQWLSKLVDTIESYPTCGAVGAKLIWPEGGLQEAGSIIWQDGSALGYGRGDNSLKPEYCYLREVDYCSAACLLVRTELFRRLGGFDEGYLPAYYEDSDLCFGIKNLGYKVIFQPAVSVFHYEFGSRSSKRAKLLCKANQPKFVRKWGNNLSQQYPNDKNFILQARERRSGPRVLVMDDQIPATYLGSGFPRARRMLKCLVELGYLVTFLPLCNRTKWQPTTYKLQQSGVEVFYGGEFNLEEILRNRSGYYDIIIISRPHNGAKFLSTVRQLFPHARLIYDAEALFCLREIGMLRLQGYNPSTEQVQRMLKQELEPMKKADVVVTVSESEREVILKERAHNNVAVWGHTHELQVANTPFSQRHDLLFVGGFAGGHPPNTDAVLHFATEVFPKIRKRLPNIRFIVVGSNPPKAIQELYSESITVTGFVQDLREYYEKCRICVVPLRFGAGINYKLTEALSYGIPAVVSKQGASGLNLTDGQQVLIAENDEEFVQKVIQLEQDEKLWHKLQKSGQQYIRDHCSPEVMRENLYKILGPREGAVVEKAIGGVGEDYPPGTYKKKHCDKRCYP